MLYILNYHTCFGYLGMLRELCLREEVGTGNVADEVVLRGLHLVVFFQALLGDRRSYFPTSGCASCGSQVQTRVVNILLSCCNRDEFRWRLPYLVASRHYVSQSRWCHSLGCGSSAKVNPPCMADSSAVRHYVATTPSRPMNPPPLSSCVIPLNPAKPEFCIKLPSVLILMHPDDENDQLIYLGASLCLTMNWSWSNNGKINILPVTGRRNIYCHSCLASNNITNMRFKKWLEPK